MSVINQVLNQLEQRGEQTPPEQDMVRPVPPERPIHILPLLAVLLALAGGAAAWQWMQSRKAPQPVANTAQPSSGAMSAAAPAPVPASAPVIAPTPAPAVEVVAEEVIAASAVDTASAVDAAGVDEAAGAEEAYSVALSQPASRLSFELGAIPLPSSLRQSASLPDAVAASQAETPASAAPLPARTQTKAAPPASRSTARTGNAPPIKQVSPEQRADAAFRQAVADMQRGHVADAIAGYRAVLRLDAGHDEARQALVALLLENKQGAEAERVLQERLNASPGQTGFAMLLARLQVEHGALEQALATLEKSLSYADTRPDYQAFFAALLQRRNRHKEAITHYQIALQLAPDNGVWLMGYGISLQAAQRNEDARDAFRRALESGTLSQELQAFVRQKIRSED